MTILIFKGNLSPKKGPTYERCSLRPRIHSLVLRDMHPAIDDIHYGIQTPCEKVTKAYWQEVTA